MSLTDIIRIVQGRPELWQLSHPLFHNKGVKRLIWRRISKDLKTDETLVKKRWKHLMDQYRKEFKKMLKQPTYQGEPGPRISTWVHYDSLAFLKDEMEMRNDRDRGKHNGSESEDNHNQDEELDVTDYENVLWNYSVKNQPVQKTPEATTSTSNVTKADLILKSLQNISTNLARNNQNDALKNDEDYMFFMSVLPTVRNLSMIKKFHFRMKVNEFLLQTLEGEEEDPLNNDEQFVPEDSKDGVINVMQTDDIES